MLNINREAFRSMYRDMRRGCFYFVYQEYGYFYTEKVWELRKRDMSKIGTRAAWGGDYHLRKMKAQYNCGMRKPLSVSVNGQNAGGGGGDPSRFKTYGDYLS